MSRSQRANLMAIVLVNLVFVHITGVVSLHWLLGLYTLALAAPALWNLQRLLPYRLAWNMGIIGIFALLLQDVMNTGIRFMLEDGLLLAAFCQVHVLNNLSRQRTPDLIYFNSFLIALVTSFFCQDLVYSIVFLVYVVLLLVSMRIASVERESSRMITKRAAIALSRSGVSHAAVIVAVTLLVFLFWPRDFQREGLVEERLGPANLREVGFTEEIRLADRRSATASDRVVLTATIVGGSRHDVPTHWRGMTYRQVSSEGWHGDRRVQKITWGYLDEPWRMAAESEWFRRGHSAGAKVTVNLRESGSRRLYAPLAIHRLGVAGVATPMADGCLRLVRRNSGSLFSSDPLTYHFALNETRVDNRQRRVNRRALASYRGLLPNSVPPEAKAIYRELAASVRRNASSRTISNVFCQHLQSRFSYAMPGKPGSARGFRAFLRGEGGGHCEYFASTLVMLLRQHGIPCRLVGGFVAREWDEAGETLTIRSKHAHAWVEVWDNEFGWRTVDPTPPIQEDAANAAEDGISWIADLWFRLTNFDSGSRAAFLKWSRSQLRNPWVWSALGALVVIQILRRRRRRTRNRPHAAVASYEIVLRQLDLMVRDGETPRQLLLRTRETDLAPAKLEVLTAATHRHERERYTSL